MSLAMEAVRLECRITTREAGRSRVELLEDVRYLTQDAVALPESATFEVAMGLIEWVCGKFGRDVRLECINGRTVATWAPPGTLTPTMSAEAAAAEQAAPEPNGWWENPLGTGVERRPVGGPGDWRAQTCGDAQPLQAPPYRIDEVL